MVKRCAFLTLDDPGDYVIDDELAYSPLRDHGWSIEAVPWRSPIDWRQFDVVVIRSPWDYQDAPEEFLAVLDRIEQQGVTLLNPLSVVRWNLDKRYLRELELRGIPIVPTEWLDHLTAVRLDALPTDLDSGEIVIKPVISANANGAFRLTIDDHASKQAALDYYSNRALMAQPLVDSILTEGEYSLFYFNGHLSHAISKRPKHGDFRVQEEHGGLITAIDPEPLLRATGQRVMDQIDQSLLYARIDLVRENNGDGYWLMELELIEPALYFRMDKQAPDRFAAALSQWVRPVEQGASC